MPQLSSASSLGAAPAPTPAGLSLFADFAPLLGGADVAPTSAALLAGLEWDWLPPATPTPTWESLGLVPAPPLPPSTTTATLSAQSAALTVATAASSEQMPVLAPVAVLPTPGAAPQQPPAPLALAPSVSPRRTESAGPPPWNASVTGAPAFSSTLSPFATDATGTASGEVSLWGPAGTLLDSSARPADAAGADDQFDLACMLQSLAVQAASLSTLRAARPPRLPQQLPLQKLLPPYAQYAAPLATPAPPEPPYTGAVRPNTVEPPPPSAMAAPAFASAAPSAETAGPTAAGPHRRAPPPGFYAPSPPSTPSPPPALPPPGFARAFSATLDTSTEDGGVGVASGPWYAGTTFDDDIAGAPPPPTPAPVVSSMEAIRLDDSGTAALSPGKGAWWDASGLGQLEPGVAGGDFGGEDPLEHDGIFGDEAGDPAVIASFPPTVGKTTLSSTPSNSSST